MVSFRRLLPGLITGLFLLAIFVVPYRCPGLTPSNSGSWEFGFSNNAARALIALLLLSLCACRLFLGGSSSPARALLEPPAPRSQRPLLATLVIFTVLACGMLTAWYRYLPYAHYGEMSYFIQRLDLMLIGRIPYRDFGFNYGPAMIWAPLDVYRLTHARLSIEDAYLVTLLLHYILGFGLIAYAAAQVPSRRPALVFVLIAFPFFNLTMGLNYAPLRFIIAPASLLAVRHIARSLPRAPLRRGAALAIAAFLLPIVNCAISPEMGLAAIGGLLVYFLWALFGPARREALPALAVLAGAAAVALVFPPDYFSSIFSFSKGTADFPLLPSAPILAMLAAAIWLLPALGVIALREKSPTGAFAAGLAVLLGLLIIPATGRCDGGHVFCNNIALFLLALSAASCLSIAWRGILTAGYIVIFPVMADIAFWNNYRPSFIRAAISRRELAAMSYVADNAAASPAPLIHSSKLLPADSWLQTLPHVPIGLPLGADEITERFLILTGRALPEYYIAPDSNLFEPGQLRRKFADLDRMQTIYVPEFYLQYLKPVAPEVRAASQARDDNAFLSSLLLLPVNLPPVNPVFYPDTEVMTRISHEFIPIKQYPAGLLLKRR